MLFNLGVTLNERSVVRGCDEYTTGVKSGTCRQKEEVTPGGDIIMTLTCRCRWDGCNGMLHSTLRGTFTNMFVYHSFFQTQIHNKNKIR